ncbi:hypothetical protein [Brevundimonas sp.]|uniref:hypothetical protein n=1 Tax=Brevundimonas sp. TaxID=1871086 RepID=UPI0025D960BB|nr:hypothetical protein [Brevundimonas sp.]
MSDRAFLAMAAEVVAPLTEPKPESRRRKRRDRTALACTLVHGIFGERHQGVVRDIHDEGARVRSSCPPSIIPDLVRLEVGGQSYDGKVVWRSDWELGVKFAFDHPATDIQVEVLRSLAARLRGGSV